VRFFEELTCDVRDVSPCVRTECRDHDHRSTASNQATYHGRLLDGRRVYRRVRDRRLLVVDVLLVHWMLVVEAGRWLEARWGLAIRTTVCPTVHPTRTRITVSVALSVALSGTGRADIKATRAAASTTTDTGSTASTTYATYATYATTSHADHDRGCLIRPQT